MKLFLRFPLAVRAQATKRVNPRGEPILDPGAEHRLVS